MNIITCTGTCPDCHKEYELIPDRFDGFLPIGGVCPHCMVRLSWKVEDQYLSKFVPSDTMVMEEGLPLQITITEVGSENS